MSGLEWFSGIIRLALDELAQWNRFTDDYWKPLRPEDVTEITIVPATQYLHNSWFVYLNWESKTPKYMTIHYTNGELWVDDL